MRAVVPGLCLVPLLLAGLAPAARAQTASQVEVPKLQVQTNTQPARGDGGIPTLAPKQAPQRQTLQQRFERANTTHDGKLTQQQAERYMPEVARNFKAIDTDHSGTVSLGEIVAWNRSHPNQAVRAEGPPNVGGIGAAPMGGPVYNAPSGQGGAGQGASGQGASGQGAARQGAPGQQGVSGQGQR